MNPVDFIYRIATGERRKRWLWMPLGPTILIACLTVLIAVSLRIDHLLKLPKFPPAKVSLIVALPFVITGLGVMLWSLLHFVLAKGTPVPFNPPPKLVTSGPYAYVRNPMYDGAFLSMFGMGILLRSPAMIFALVPSLILLVNWLLRYIEEPELERRLGEDYFAYKRRVRRFLP